MKYYSWPRTALAPVCVLPRPPRTPPGHQMRRRPCSERPAGRQVEEQVLLPARGLGLGPGPRFYFKSSEGAGARVWVLRLARGLGPGSRFYDQRGGWGQGLDCMTSEGVGMGPGSRFVGNLT